MLNLTEVTLSFSNKKKNDSDIKTTPIPILGKKVFSQLQETSTLIKLAYHNNLRYLHLMKVKVSSLKHHPKNKEIYILLSSGF